MPQTQEPSGLTGVWSPDSAEVEAFRRDGWLVSPKFLPDALLDDAWVGIESLLEGEANLSIASGAAITDLRFRDGDVMDQIGYLSLRVEAVRRLTTHIPLAEAAARLVGARGIRLFHDRLIVKPPESDRASTVGWHIDRAYWLTCTSPRMLTAWIPFQDIDAHMGPLMVVSGSHRWQGNEHMATSHRSDMDRLLEEARVEAGREPSAMVLRRGQVSFHHCLALHGSLPNRGDRPRAALAVHLQPADNRYQPVFRPGGRRLAHTNDLLCRAGPDGHPDYTDPAVFPLLWGTDE